jgi:AcrR family transcriptional regulator
VTCIERDGLNAFSVRRLASELGCGPMTIYQYVSGIDDILAAAVDSVFETVDIPKQKASKKGSQKEWLLLLSQRVRNVMIAHPNMTPVIGLRLLPGGIAEQRILDAVVGCLAEHPHPRSLADRLNAFLGGLIGYVMMELSTPPSEQQQREQFNLPNLAAHAKELDGRVIGARSLTTVSLLPGGFELLMGAVISDIV